MSGPAEFEALVERHRLAIENPGRICVGERRLAASLYEQSLVSDFRPETATLRLHDVVRAYLRERLGEAGVAAAHQALLSAAARHYALATDHTRPDHEPDGAVAALRAWWDLPASARYLWRHLVGHLHGAGLRAERQALLEDPRWFAAKIRRVATRLVPGWPLPDTPDPAAVRVLTGHTSGVIAVAVVPDGTWRPPPVDDRTVRIWDAPTTYDHDSSGVILYGDQDATRVEAAATRVMLRSGSRNPRRD